MENIENIANVIVNTHIDSYALIYATTFTILPLQSFFKKKFRFGHSFRCHCLRNLTEFENIFFNAEHCLEQRFMIIETKNFM